MNRYDLIRIFRYCLCSSTLFVLLSACWKLLVYLRFSFSSIFGIFVVLILYPYSLFCFGKFIKSILLKIKMEDEQNEP